MARTETVTYNMPLRRCPSCAYQLNAAHGDGVPSPGDLTVCMSCHTRLVYTADMHVRLMTDGEYAALPPDERAAIDAAGDRLRAYSALFGRPGGGVQGN